MNNQLQTVMDFIQQNENISAEEKAMLIKEVKKVSSDLEIAEFKLERTEKVKRTTAILLEETIEELEQKRKAIEESNAALTKSLEELKATQSTIDPIRKNGIPRRTHRRHCP
jgi:two-component system, NtrC family, sensor kinase